MGSLFRIIAVVVEVAILMVLVYALFSSVLSAVIDLGVDQKYKRYLSLVMTIIGGLALFFFFAHLITFYPRIPH